MIGFSQFFWLRSDVLLVDLISLVILNRVGKCSAPCGLVFTFLWMEFIASFSFFCFYIIYTNKGFTIFFQLSWCFFLLFIFGLVFVDALLSRSTYYQYIFYFSVIFLDNKIWIMVWCPLAKFLASLFGCLHMFCSPSVIEWEWIRGSWDWYEGAGMAILLGDVLISSLLHICLL